MKWIGVIIFFVSCVLLSCNNDDNENENINCINITPKNGKLIKKGDIVTISIEVQNNDKSATEVFFLIDNIGVSSVNKLPYKYNWNSSNENTGVHSIKVISIDNNGEQCSSETNVFITDDEPIANFSLSNTEIFKNNTVEFKDLSLNTPTSWIWDFGDGNTSKEQNPSHTYLNSGKFTISLTVSNLNGTNTLTKSEYLEVKEYLNFNPNITYGTLTDIEDNVYKTVKIGTQTWMAENLRTTKLNDGNEINFINHSDAEWSISGLGYTWYQHDISNAPKYGAIYKWAETYTQKLCPKGWHMPSENEWDELIEYLGGIEAAPRKLREAGDTHWAATADINTNEYGFTAVLSGLRYINGAYHVSSSYWSSTGDHFSDLAIRYTIEDGTDTEFGDKISKEEVFIGHGYCVRCVKD